jgi:ssDNA-binding Zn-finger/Zn-ribbon topoisomerase 1
MSTRRGTTVLSSDFAKQVTVFQVDDVVTSVVAGSVDFIGTVIAVDYKLKKILVNWGDGSSVQHDPDEIQHLPNLLIERMEKEGKMASRRGSMDTNVPSGDQFVGDPKTHGIDSPRGGGFSIMQNLQKDLAPEALAESKEGPKVDVIQGSLKSRRGMVAAITENVMTTWNDDGSISECKETEWDAEDAGEWASRSVEASVGMRSRRAMYWMDKGRVYRLTKGEQECGAANCPKCKSQMNKEPFTKKEKLWNCPECGFKVPTSATMTQRPKIEIEIDPDGSVEVEVEPVEKEMEASRRGRHAAAEGVPTDLNRMKINELAALVDTDWKRVNFGAKPYLDAMFSLGDVDDMYGLDTGRSIVAYFLANANTWRGDMAKAVKAELKKRIR